MIFPRTSISYKVAYELLNLLKIINPDYFILTRVSLLSKKSTRKGKIVTGLQILLL